MRIRAGLAPRIRTTLPALAVALLLACGVAKASPPSNSYFTEDFDYTLGTNLVGKVNPNGTWQGSAGNQIMIDTAGPQVKMTGGLTSYDAYQNVNYSGLNGVIWAHFKVYRGAGGGATMWTLRLDDTAGNNLARYYGASDTCRGRIGDGPDVTGQYNLTQSVWNDLDIKINTTANTSEFFLNGASIGVLNHTTTPNNTLGKIRFERLSYDPATGHTIFFDELRVGEPPSNPTAPPAAPTVTSPASGAVTNTDSPQIQWTGDSHDKYEVHVNTTDVATDADGWDSGQVAGSANSCTTGNLVDNTRYYVYARLHNALGWGAWSSTGYYIDVLVVPMIIPLPQSLSWKMGTGFQVNSATRIVMNTNPDAKETNTANQLQRKVWDMTGQLPAIVQGGVGAPTSNVIAIGDPARNIAVSSIIAAWPEASGKAFKSEGYMLGISDNSIVIRGFDNPGTFYGCQTLIQLLENYRTGRIPGLFCYDYPDLPWRGTYFRIKWTHDWAFSKELMSEMLARFKMNRIFPDVYMPYNSHPECPPPPDAVTQADYADFIDFCKLHYITDIEGPDVSVFGTDGSVHSDWRENQSLAIGQPNDLCFRNPNARVFLNDVRNELINLTGTQYIQTGMSEFRQLGWDSCPHCGPYSNAWLYSDFLTKDRNELYNGRGVTPIIWGDMLNPNQNGSPSLWNTASAVDTMPNETIIFDWLYGTPGNVPTDYPSLDIWIAHGKKACGSPYGFGNHPEYSQFYGDKENIYYWANAVYSRRASYPNLMLGIMAFNKYTCNGKRAILDSPLSMDFLQPFPFYGEWGWNPDGRYWNPYPFDGKAVIRAEISPDRVSNLAASLNGGNVMLSWTNPPDAACNGAYIVYRTDRAPTSPIDGILVGDQAGSPNGYSSFIHTAAPLGATIYYAAFSHDGVRHFSPPVTASVANGSPLSLSDLSALLDGRTVNVAGGVVTSIYQECFYVQTEGRINGLRVESTEPVTVGQIVTINGILGKTGHERSIAALSVTGTGQKLLTDPCLKPFTLNNMSIGGADNGTIPGSGGVGANNVGSLVMTVGKVENPDPGGAFFYLNDGSIPEGIKVKLTGTKTAISIPSQGYVSVAGVSSLDTDGKAVIWPRSQTDITPLQ
ncbi:MAG: glycoside hydrolase family 20 zincin-like fold domain-containing protein [Armatimonadota bacterium]|nr:glycoside hydrolase family 20 zincin-like fold domain-containing protein [Armatimonadota bacterium]